MFESTEGRPAEEIGCLKALVLIRREDRDIQMDIVFAVQLCAQIILKIRVEEFVRLPLRGNEVHFFLASQATHETIEENVCHVIVEDGFFIMKLRIDLPLIQMDHHDGEGKIAQLLQKSRSRSFILMVCMEAASVLRMAVLHSADRFGHGTFHGLGVFDDEDSDDEVHAHAFLIEVEAQIAGFIEENVHES